jgi:biotin transport system substrate-specific component
MAHSIAHPASVTAQPSTATSLLERLNAATHTLPRKAILVVSASLFVAVAAHCIVPLPFTPVPLTLGDLAVVLVGLVLAPELAFAALALYLAEGAAGLPVFAPTSSLPGIAHLMGPTGGYLFAYPFAAAIASYLVRKLQSLPDYAAGSIAAFTGGLVIMSSGAAWIGIYLHHSAALTFQLAVLPFLPGQLVKILSAAGIYSAAATRTR